MTCSRYRDLISRYVDNEVTPRQRSELLAHVQHCHGCAAWLARLRQTDVLLKGVPETHPSDRVREAILSTALKGQASGKEPPGPLRGERSKAPAPHAQHLTGSGWHMYASSLLLRFELQPGRIGLALAAAAVALFGLAYWTNQVRPFWGYDKFGFLYPGESASAAATPTPLAAISSGVGGRGGPVAAPNLISSSPGDGDQDVPGKQPLRVRFDQPMDRASVEGALRIDPPAGGSFSWGADNEVSFVPSGDGLLGGITYTLSLTLTARSLAGSPVVEPAQWAFRTRDPFSVAGTTEPGAAVPPTQTFTLVFTGPMDRAATEKAVALAAEGPDGKVGSLPVAFNWDADGRILAVSPVSPVPEGKVHLRVSAGARTQSGEARASGSEFTYAVELPTPRLRLFDGRVAIAGVDSPVKVPYEALGPRDSALSQVDLQVYDLPGSRISALSAQARDWPAPLPAGFTAALHQIGSARSNPLKDGTEQGLASALLPALGPGTYLLVASARSQADVLVDWQLLVVADRALSMVDGDTFWATTPAGKPWPGAEISLYTAGGTLLDKGVSQEAGLWTSASQPDAALALARDLEGHTAAMLLTGGQVEKPLSDLDARLTTDSPSYYPGQQIQFRVLLGESGAGQLPATEQEVGIGLVNPQGMAVSVLTLKPDTVGGVSGTFDLAPDALPGRWILRATVGTAHRDFPVQVNPTGNETLAVRVLQLATPSDPFESAGQTVTCTIGVLTQHGEPAPSALLTGTLRIRGDAWASAPVTATTGPDGRATISLPLPTWASQFNEPGLYIETRGEWSGNQGSDTAALDLSSPRRLSSGYSDMVSPSLNFAAISQPQKGGPRVRLVTLAAPGQDEKAGGDILVLAVSCDGERQAWPMIDLEAAGGDVTLQIPPRFNGGTLMLFRAGHPAGRQMQVPFQAEESSLHVVAPPNVASNSSLPVTLNLLDKEGQGMGGVVTLYMRRVSGLDAGEREQAPSWQPSARIEMSGTTTVNLAAPASPGLWAIVAEAADPGSLRVSARTVVSVDPAPGIVLPPSVVAGSDDTALSIAVYNPALTRLVSVVRADGGQDIDVREGSSQAVDVAPGDWQKLEWHIRSRVAGTPLLSFSFQPGAQVEVPGTWTMPVQAESATDKSTTYASGTLSGQQTVGVQVPSGMDNDVHLHVRVTTSLLSALCDAAAEISGRQNSRGENALAWASRLAVAPLVASAYRRANLDSPPDLSISGPQRSIALQEIYALRHTDGGWSKETDLTAPSNPVDTAEVLLAIRRQSLAWTESGQDPQPQFDSQVESRALAFLLNTSLSPIEPHATTAQLDARAHSLYALSLYGAVGPGDIRPLMAYASGLGGAELSQAGQAWLALALWQAGDSPDALAVLDRALGAPVEGPEAAAPMLDAIVTMNSANRRSALQESAQAAGSQAAAAPGAITSSRLADSELAMEYVAILMGARRGAAWLPSYEADAVWSLAGYASQEDPGSVRPGVVLNDGTVLIGAQAGNPDTFTADISGGTLHAGTNWLRLQAPPSRFLYYSLILKAPR